MPDLSDVGPPTKGPGLPYRVPEAPPPPVRVKIEHGKSLDSSFPKVLKKDQSKISVAMRSPEFYRGGLESPDESLPSLNCNYRQNVAVAQKICDEILINVPEAIVETKVGAEDSCEIEINGKLIFSRANLGKDPDIEEIVEITKWGNKGKSFLHMYLCSVAEGAEPRMVITDRRNTPLAKRVVMACTIQ